MWPTWPGASQTPRTPLSLVCGRGNGVLSGTVCFNVLVLFSFDNSAAERITKISNNSGGKELGVPVWFYEMGWLEATLNWKLHSKM